MGSQSVENTISNCKIFSANNSTYHNSATVMKRKWTCEERLSILSASSDAFLQDTRVLSWISSRLEDVESLKMIGNSVHAGHYEDIEKYLGHVKAVAVASLFRFEISPFQLGIIRDILSLRIFRSWPTVSAKYAGFHQR